MDRGAWRATVQGVTKSWTRLTDFHLERLLFKDRLEFEQAPGVGDAQGSLACCSPWGRKELDTT